MINDQCAREDLSPQKINPPNSLTSRYQDPGRRLSLLSDQNSLRLTRKTTSKVFSIFQYSQREGVKMKREHCAPVYIVEDGCNGMLEEWNQDRLTLKIMFSVLSGMLQERGQAGKRRDWQAFMTSRKISKCKWFQNTIPYCYYFCVYQAPSYKG